ncbi:MAG: DnaJ domain-containing protein [Actinobacteria bacterium]|nr:DnaJ domain-containing protein [Actinomycetota bacterium]
MEQEDYYEILQVHHKAGPEVIKRAFKALAGEYHPDKHLSSKEKWAGERFKMIREAYDVLSDPVSRSEYDLFIRTRAGEASARGRDIEYEREAFHHLRCGLQYYERSTGEGLLNSLLGRWVSDLEKSRAHLLKVISSLPDAALVEDARYYYFCVLTRLCDYSMEYFESVEDELELFLSDYPSSKWVPHIKLEMADFYVAKCLDFQQARVLLEEVIGEAMDEELISACSARLAYLEEKSAHRCGSCGRKLSGNREYCYRCCLREKVKENGEDTDSDELVSKGSDK